MRGSRPFAALAFLLALSRATAVPLALPDGASVDLPEGWGPVGSASAGAFSFADPTRTAVLQIFLFAGGAFPSAKSLQEAVCGSLNASSQAASFSYSGLDAALVDLRFPTSSSPAHGYGLFVLDESRQYALLAFTSEELYETHHDALLSALDSFAPGPLERMSPGAISQFTYPFAGLAPAVSRTPPGRAALPPAPQAQRRSLDLPVGKVVFLVDEEENLATQVLVEREARVLALAKTGFVSAWRRYYRTIYRDNFHRLAPVARSLGPELRSLEPRERARRIVSWVQGFEYYRTGTLSDLTSPLACLTNAAGDCDSRALLVVILLHHLGVDASLLVSSTYSHSAVGIDVPGPGARMPAEGRSLLFAEVTESVDLGLVASDMADPSAWVVVALGESHSDAFAEAF